MRKRLFALLLLATPAAAQTVPNGTIYQGQTWNAGQWNSAWQAKADVANPAFTGQLTVTNLFSSFPTNGPAGIVVGSQIANSLTAGWSGGTYGTVVANHVDYANITGAPNNFLWDHLSALSYSGTGGTGQHVADYAQAVRHTFSAGGAASNPQVWGAVAESDDFTGQKSSLTNAQLSEEFDLTASNVDDAGNRQSQSIVLWPWSGGPGYAGFNGGIGITANAGAYPNHAFGFGGDYVNAIIDFRYASSAAKGAGGLNVPISVTTTAPITASATIPVSNVMPFTVDVYGRDINKTPSSGNITFGDGQGSIVTAYTITGTGPTPAGTLTVANPITVASGVAVYNQSNAIWLPTGQAIALDTTGATTIGSDGTTITATGNETVTGTLTAGAVTVGGLLKVPNGIQIGTNSGSTINTNGGNLVVAINLPARVPGYAAASLPAVTSANQGTIAFCNNCFNQNETVASGVIVTQDINGAWLTPWGQVATAAATAPSLVVSQPVQLAQFTIGAGGSQIPACASGTKGGLAYVTDGAATPVYNATQAGGGSTVVKVFCNGSNWVNG